MFSFRQDKEGRPLREWDLFIQMLRLPAHKLQNSLQETTLISKQNQQKKKIHCEFSGKVLEPEAVRTPYTVFGNPIHLMKSYKVDSKPKTAT